LKKIRHSTAVFLLSANALRCVSNSLPILPFCSSQPEFFLGLIPEEIISGGRVSSGFCEHWPPNNLLLKDFTCINEIQEMLRNHFEMNNTEAIPRGIIWDALNVVVREHIRLTVS
jgi:hypothetical protein